uniref:DNA-directed RNA polymerase n=1 Tax=Streptomyces kasugaensis TaxID=1946 RepID=Q8GAU1_STRKA|nr:hypothetical truncated polypeptide [Streptomyces kasugaensis]
MSSSITAPEGIINPPIDELLEATDSKYSLVIYAAKRAPDQRVLLAAR